ncbi:thioredoxin domain-containing protein 12-like [Oscarella lobularis]|uniref:thioredoxin domain-containing protein 12-like n=1 Tax=Oscarella lobularis TaxID=121494 RepID=UPI003313CEFF
MRFFVVFGLLALSNGADDLAKGWGDEIAWRTLNDGLVEAKESQKPLMLLIHKSWCGACKALKPQFADSEEIRTLSEQFVMVNVQDDEEPKDPKYAPDGSYIPRILFLDSNGEVKRNINNAENNPSYKYYYSDPHQITAMMKSALASASKEEL